MKRFFQPVKQEERASFKKRDVASAEESKEVEGGKGETPVEGGGTGEGDPTKFLSWNANSFLLRVKNNRTELFELIKTFDPDVIALQEIRMPAAGRNGERKNQSAIKDDTNAARDDKQTLMGALSSKPFSEYQAWWSLAGSKYSGTALLIKHCFKPSSVRFSIDTYAPAATHEADGRIIIAEFKTFRLMNTYVPNNGWKDEDVGFKRRRQWDKQIHEFVTLPCEKPLIWCGDLNVSHEDVDVSEPFFFQNAKQKGYTPPNSDDIGQPGFTKSERKRFGKILEEGKLVDSYRCLHPKQEPDNGFSWSGNPVGKYRGKRMRIDYFLVPRQLAGRLIRSDICGSGIELQGFCGSDHCPIVMEFSPSSDGAAAEPSNSPEVIDQSCVMDDLQSSNGARETSTSLELADKPLVTQEVLEMFIGGVYQTHDTP